MSAAEISPADLRLLFLTRLALLRALTPAEQVELAQLEAAETAQRQPEEPLQ